MGRVPHLIKQAGRGLHERLRIRNRLVQRFCCRGERIHAAAIHLPHELCRRVHQIVERNSLFTHDDAPMAHDRAGALAIRRQRTCLDLWNRLLRHDVYEGLRDETRLVGVDARVGRDGGAFIVDGDDDIDAVKVRLHAEHAANLDASQLHAARMWSCAGERLRGAVRCMRRVQNYYCGRNWQSEQSRSCRLDGS